jgi:hypothetical protein
MTTFLLSPAYCGGRRAAILLRPGSAVPLAQRLQSGSLRLGEAFSFLSGLYFRGKLTYALEFGAASTLVITPTRGLRPPDMVVDGDVLREFASVDVNAADARYRAPLERDETALSLALSPQARVVLLGSVATGKYVDVLASVLGDRLHYPVAFAGRGDMSRGGLLLRSARARLELDYAVVRPDVRVRGPRPPKLPPETRVPPRFGTVPQES